LEAKAPDEPYFLWQVAGKAVSVRIPFALMDRLGDEVAKSFRSLNSLGSEIGGVLLGRVVPGELAIVSVEDYAVVVCDYTTGPLYQLSHADLERLDAAIRPRTAFGVRAVGFFRSHTRRGLGLGPEDVALMQSRFQDPTSIALLIRPASRAGTAGIFIWESGEIHCESSYSQFPFRSSALSSGNLLPHEMPEPGSSARPAAPVASPASISAQVVPITSRMEVSPSPTVAPVVAPSGKPGAAQAALRVSLEGVLENERAELSKLLQSCCKAVIVKDRSYNVLLVDTSAPGATRKLRERVVGAVIVIVSSVAGREMPGAVTLRRPWTPDTIRAVFGEVQGLVSRRAGVLPRQVVKQTREHKGQSFSSLYDLATAYRSSLSKNESVALTIEGHKFLLYPSRRLFKSDHSPMELRSLRGNTSLTIEVAKPGDASSIEGLPELPMQRLEDFLWHLGFNSGGGSLFPWVSEQSLYRLNRWPPVVRKDNDSTLVRLATLMAMARRALRPEELVETEGISPYIVADFLNGCSLVGCLEECTIQPDVAPAPARARNPLLKLLGRIRGKLGLT
jgi:hypothetical protein